MEHRRQHPHGHPPPSPSSRGTTASSRDDLPEQLSKPFLKCSEPCPELHPEGPGSLPVSVNRPVTLGRTPSWPQDGPKRGRHGPIGEKPCPGPTRAVPAPDGQSPSETSVVACSYSLAYQALIGAQVRRQGKQRIQVSAGPGDRLPFGCPWRNYPVWSVVAIDLGQESDWVLGDDFAGVTLAEHAVRVPL